VCERWRRWKSSWSSGNSLGAIASLRAERPVAVVIACGVPDEASGNRSFG
jgi:hypothetical protein